MKRENKKEVPGLVKAIAILYYIYAVVSLIALFGATIYFIIKNISTGGEGIDYAFAALGALVGLFVYLPFGVLALFVARGLWKGKNWARKATIILSSMFLFLFLSSSQFIFLDILYTLGVLFIPRMYIVTILIHLFIVIYLLFNKRVKEAFA